MPTVQRRTDIEDWVFDEARVHLARKPRTGIHVSDLLTPRKGYWGRVQGGEITRTEALYFLAGRAHEEVVVALAGLEAHHKIQGEWLGTPGDPYPQGKGVKYEVDVVAPHQSGPPTPVEFKTNRRPRVIAPEDVAEQYSTYLDQLRMYCVARDSSSGYLMVLHLMARSNIGLDAEGEPDPYSWLKQSRPEFITYQIDFSEAELEATRQQMQERRRMLELALEIQDHTILVECPEWMCGKEHTRSSDPYCPQCKTVYKVGEEREDGKKQGVLKKCRVCKVRPDLMRDTQTVFVPSCRFWPVCLPSQWAQHHASYFHPGPINGS